MCPPCKVVVNDGAESAAAGMTLLTELILGAIEDGTMSREAGDAIMPKMATAEVALIKAHREARMDFARNVSTATPEWVDLMETI